MLILYQLKVSVESMAEIIRQFEGQVEKEYERVKTELLEEVQVNEKMGELV